MALFSDFHKGELPLHSLNFGTIILVPKSKKLNKYNNIDLSVCWMLFFWLNRLSTRALLKRKNMYLEDYNCVFCNLDHEEDLFHLFFHCPFAVSYWYSLNVLVPNSLDLEFLLQSFKSQLRVPFFVEVIVTMCWSIWSMRNDAIFNNLAPSLQRCKMVFRKEFALVILRGKAKFHPLVDQWLEVFV